MQPEGPARYWVRDGFFLTTDKSFVDPFKINEVFDSELMWWNDPLDIDQMRKMLANSMTFTIYSVPDTADEMKRKFVSSFIRTLSLFSTETVISPFYLPLPSVMHTRHPQNHLTNSTPRKRWPPQRNLWRILQARRLLPRLHRLRHLCLPHRRLHPRRLPAPRSRLVDDACPQGTHFRLAQLARPAAHDGQLGYGPHVPA